MIEIIAHNMAPIMFASLVIFLLIGYPVAFSLAANGLLFFAIGVELAPYSGGEINLFWPLLGALPDRFFGGIMANDTLLAIPFFTFMGLVLERSGMAEDLLDTIGQLFGPLRGGLAYAVILVGALLGAVTGVVPASVIAMGLISLPIMLRYGYDRQLAAGVIAASGTLTQLIPPSLVLIVLADQLGRSVGDMYSGAVVPGLVLTGLYMLYVFIMSVLFPASVPALPPEARTLGRGVTSLLVLAGLGIAAGYVVDVPLAAALGADSWIWAATVATLFVYGVAAANGAFGLNWISYLAQQVVIVIIPPLALIFLVLGTVFLGIATPTEGGAMGAAGALVLALAKRKLSFTLLRQAVESTTKLSTFVVFILIGARVFSLTFYGVNGHIWVEELLTALPGGETGFLIAVNVLVFLLAFFLDFFELAFIIVPLLAPIADKLGIDLIWFGVLLGVNMQTSFMHPPFGFALFYLRSVAPRGPYRDKVTGRVLDGVSTGQIYKGAIPFVFIQLIMVGLTIGFPGMVLRYKSDPLPPPEAVQTAPQTSAQPGSIRLPPLGQAGGGNGQNNPFGLPPLGLPPLGGAAPGGAAAAPAAPARNNPLGLPPLGLPPLGSSPPTGQPSGAGAAPAAPPRPANDAAAPRPPAVDLSQPPPFN